MKLFNKSDPNKESETPSKEYLQFDDEEFEGAEEEDFLVAAEKEPDDTEPVEEEGKQKSRLRRGKLGMLIWIPLLFASVFILYQSMADFFTEPEELPSFPPVVKEPVKEQQDENKSLVDLLEEYPAGEDSPESEDVKDQADEAVQSPALSASMVLSVLDQNNTKMVDITLGTFDYASRYMNRQANRSGLRSHLIRSLDEKNTAHSEFVAKENLFNSEELRSVYEATLMRNEASIEFTKRITAELESGSRNLSPLIDNHRDQDNFMQNSQHERIVDYLKAADIHYEADPVTGTIHVGA